jgi:two-component system, cell cycle sensor histidine kinase and response regulator CckA
VARLPTMDEERERLLGTGTMVFMVAMVGVALLDLALWAASGASAALCVLDLGLAAVAFLAGLTARLILRDGNFRHAATLFVVALAARIAVTVAVTVPDAYATLAPAYLVAIVIGQVLLGLRAGVYVGLGSVPMFLLAYVHLLTEPDSAATVLEAALGNLLVYVLVGGFVHATLARAEDALRRSSALLAENARARRELQESEEQFRVLAESSPTAIVIEQDGHLVYANPRFAEMCRSNRADVHGFSLWDFFAPQDAATLRAHVAARRATGARSPDQLQFRLPDGQTFWCEIAAADAVYRQQDAVVANLMDVTERVLAAQAVQRERDFSNSIISAADAIIMVLDEAGRVVVFNPAGERVTGYSGEELRGKVWYEHVVAPEGRAEAARWFASVKAACGRGGVEVPWVTRTGEECRVAWRYVCQTNEWGAVSGLIAVGIDVTQQRLLEQQAIAAERLRALGQVAGGVAHDLNNTLAGIMGPADLLLLDEEDPERRAELETIMSAAARGADTVRRIQHFAKARTDMEQRAFELAPLVDEVISLLRPKWRDAAQLQGATIRVENRVPSDLRLRGNAGEIGNVLTNLIVNACEAMPAGGAVVVSGRQRGPMGVLEVADNGTGIPEETLAHIYEPFFSTKGPDHNSGLGLAVIRGIVLRHGGTIEVTSKLGKGTRFVISLPAAPPPVPAAGEE